LAELLLKLILIVPNQGFVLLFVEIKLKCGRKRLGQYWKLFE